MGETPKPPAQPVAVAVLALSALLPSCVPELDDRSFLVAGPRVLAITSMPAEAAPPAAITYRALYVDENGPRSADLAWAFCVARKALTDPGTVSPDCLAPSGAGLTSVGAGPTASGLLPGDACRLFGPDPPDEVTGMPAGRPVDPDPTGGFYQPVRLLVSDPGNVYSLGATRIACGLAGGTATASSDFAARYRENENPAIASLSLVRAGGTTSITPDVPGAAPGATVMRGESVTLHAAWVACPTTPVCGDGVCGIDETAMSCAADCTRPVGCTGSEHYLAFDLATMALTAAREVITVAWYATGGMFADDRSGRDQSEADTPSLDNAWVAPSAAGEVRLWLVVRDDRGGVGWQNYRVRVE
jgi:hypothetical protein